LRTSGSALPRQAAKTVDGTQLHAIASTPHRDQVAAVSGRRLVYEMLHMRKTNLRPFGAAIDTSCHVFSLLCTRSATAQCAQVPSSTPECDSVRSRFEPADDHPAADRLVTSAVAAGILIGVAPLQ
jgi:hypothetical protein